MDDDRLLGVVVSSILLSSMAAEVPEAAAVDLTRLSNSSQFTPVKDADDEL